MPREVEPQSERFAGAPHLEDLPDSAYEQPTHLRPTPEDWNPWRRRYEPDPYEHNTPDEESGYNWGPPPDEHYDPGVREDSFEHPFPHH